MKMQIKSELKQGTSLLEHLFLDSKSKEINKLQSIIRKMICFESCNRISAEEAQKMVNTLEILGKFNVLLEYQIPLHDLVKLDHYTLT